jgi:hypothetical protein
LTLILAVLLAGLFGADLLTPTLNTGVSQTVLVDNICAISGALPPSASTRVTTLVAPCP